MQDHRDPEIPICGFATTSECLCINYVQPEAKSKVLYVNFWLLCMYNTATAWLYFYNLKFLYTKRISDYPRFFHFTFGSDQKYHRVITIAVTIQMLSAILK